MWIVTVTMVVFQVPKLSEVTIEYCNSNIKCIYGVILIINCKQGYNNI